MNAKKILLALVAATILAATPLAGACVEKVGPCEEFNSFAELYGGTFCPTVDVWATECATNLDKLRPEVRQDFDWCVECFRELDTSSDLDCKEAPLGEDCPILLNETLDASCNWTDLLN